MGICNDDHVAILAEEIQVQYRRLFEVGEELARAKQSYVFDNKGKTADRYTVLFGGSMLDDSLLKYRKVSFLGMSNDPTNPWFGVSMWGECDASWRPSHWRIRWLDMPEHIRDHVIRRATYDPQ